MAADQVEGAALAAAMLEAEKAAVGPKKELDDMSANVRSWNAKLEEIDRELAGAPPEKDWAALKAEAESQVAEYAEASAINGRLSREIAELEAKQRGYTCTSENLAQWQDEARQVVAALEHQRGDAEILRHNHNQLSEELETIRGKLSRVAEAVTTQKTRAAAAGDAALAVGAKIEGLASVPVLRAKLQAIGDVVTSEALATVLGELRLAETAYNEQVGKVEAARKAMADADGRLAEIDLRVAEQKNRITLAEELSRLAAAFKPSGVTMDFLDYQFGQIASLTQEHLSEMGADFMVAASESKPLAFEFLRLNRPNEAWLKQSRMSGGQKVRLALAVLLAIHELVIPDVGLLVLDEPSLHLDEDAKLTFGEVIRDLCEAGGEEGRQIIICDHDQRLMSSLPDVMEFGQL
jgi:exonuclease SbcC